jgi:hypothetical protein
MIKTPVAFIIFKRPDTTEKVFEAIRQAKPPKLLIIADGPRADKPGEAEKCAATRAIIDRVDWDCEVLKNYTDVNMGCKRRVSSGLDWVFNTVEEAIILEDDCLPHPTFFRFCEELLEKYRDDKRIMTIGGTNLFIEWKSNIQSYYFSNYFHCWGWATWKRVWNYYDVDMKLWSDPKVKERVRAVIADNRQYFNRKKHLDNTYSGKVDSWDHQFFFMCLAHSGLSIRPSVNLISNLGFTKEATHTTVSDPRSNLPLCSMTFPLKEPLDIVVDREHDYRQYKKVWQQSLSKRIFNKAKRLLLSRN